MNERLYKNIDLVEIPIKAGQDEYFFPQNVAWSGKKIDAMVICAPQIACVSPTDGVTPVLAEADLSDCYINLYGANEKELLHDVSFEQLIHTNNHKVRVDSALNLSLCKLYFTTSPAQEATLLIYVYYETREVEDFDLPTRSVTAVFDMEADQELTFQEIINQYVHALPAKIKGIVAWDAETAPAYLTMRDTALKYNFRNVHTELARPFMNGGSAQNSQVQPMWLDDIDIDFDYSRIRNAQSTPVTQRLTFYY